MRPRVCSAPVAVLVAVALAAGAGAAPVQVGPDVPAVSAAVVAIVVGDGLASGFVAEPGLVLTSLHVIGEGGVARGYCVSTIGLDEEKIRKYVQWHEKQEKQVEAVQGKLFD